MIIESKNFHIILQNGDGLCMGDVQTNYNFNTGEYPRVMVGEEFIIEVSNFALNLAEKKYFNNK